MGFISNLFSNRKVKDQLLLKKAEEAERSREYYQLHHIEKNRIEMLLINSFEEKIKNFDINEYYKLNTGLDLDIKEGDIVVPNFYNLRKNSGNNWDGGAGLIISEGGRYHYKNPEPLLCKIEKIFVDKSILYDLIDTFLKNCTKFDKRDDDYTIRFNNWLTTNYKSYAGLPLINGLYVSATISVINKTFNPKWSLNIFSFLPENSKEGKKTYQIWDAVYKAQQKIEKLEQQIENLKIKNHKQLETLKLN